MNRMFMVRVQFIKEQEATNMPRLRRSTLTHSAAYTRRATNPSIDWLEALFDRIGLNYGETYLERMIGNDLICFWHRSKVPKS